jgi:hypothetical protein
LKKINSNFISKFLIVIFKGTEQEQALLDLQQVHDNNALIGHIKKPMLSREGTVDSEMLDFATDNITTLHPDDSAEVVDSNGAEGNETFRMTLELNTKDIKRNSISFKSITKLMGNDIGSGQARSVVYVH